MSVAFWMGVTGSDPFLGSSLWVHSHCSIRYHPWVILQTNPVAKVLLGLQSFLVKSEWEPPQLLLCAHKTARILRVAIYRNSSGFVRWSNWLESQVLEETRGKYPSILETNVGFEASWPTRRGMYHCSLFQVLSPVSPWILLVCDSL